MSNTILRLAGVIRESIVDGPGIRFTVFVQGCPHHCPGCHNPQSHDFQGGSDCRLDKLVEEIQKDPLLPGGNLFRRRTLLSGRGPGGIRAEG